MSTATGGLQKAPQPLRDLRSGPVGREPTGPPQRPVRAQQRPWYRSAVPFAAALLGLAAVTSVAFNPDGPRLASAAYQDPSLRIWNTESGEVEQKLHGPYHDEGSYGHSIHFVAWSPDGTRLAASNWSAVAIFNPASGTPQLVLEGHRFGVGMAATTVAWRPDGQQIATGDEAGSLRFWDARTGQLQGTVGLAVLDGSHCRFSPDGTTLAVAVADDMTVRLLSAQDGRPQRTLDALQIVEGDKGEPRREVSWLAWGPKSRRLFTGIINDDPDRREASRRVERIVQVWNVQDGTVGAWKRDLGHYLLALSPGGRRVAAGLYPNDIFLWTPETDTIQRAVKIRRPFRALAWSPDGRWFAVAFEPPSHNQGTPNQIGIFHARNGTPGPVLEGHRNIIYQLAFSPDSRWLASASADHTVRLWKVEAGQQPTDAIVWPLQEGYNRYPARSVAWSPDGKWLAAGSWYDPRVWLWDVTARKPGPVFRCNSDGLSSGAFVAFSPDSRQVCRAGRDRLLQVFDVSSGRTRWIAVMLADGAVAAFTPAGQLLHGDPDVLERQLVYLVEMPGERTVLRTPSEFQRETGVRTIFAGDDRERP